MRVTEDALNTPASGTSGEAIGIVETVGMEGAKHVTDRNRFFLGVLLFRLRRSSNCYPLDFQKSLNKLGRMDEKLKPFGL